MEIRGNLSEGHYFRARASTLLGLDSGTGAKTTQGLQGHLGVQSGDSSRSHRRLAGCMDERSNSRTARCRTGPELVGITSDGGGGGRSASCLKWFAIISRHRSPQMVSGKQSDWL
ncbi:hypothetical protein ACOMHN_011192 [Nucella lapillus]